ncbi:MAG: ribonuclease HI [Candidatus Zambryskibacteria bacterium RIFCSPHIGHO2_02_FULL_43_14]|uniref:Ribonuclease H n=1 Tax=Candidatus Zambryskibacteria bacterium RIFCSPHIGHO2_02_FULL_43_14 TaxID=1802748 RepID=A0A1G2TGH2_9BACT|nr:MAG: ribonuclease HI [Candidatus Zambryskibacteria bacterium RIFCSPHIGHO2_01_FULL_43_60]OHA96138.1 MAG: ribonuclease HI [Candidatus Zambryskibacteria bacterium RIFCSPHIGHO2_02_FULL_43_14]OHB03138.1 MAG: ribonuclease HI [Candidatus Zambryskibacteria bacterium RIFCSPLOWO2_01_FULL_42_41]
MITIYTDGSSRNNPGPGGWGVVVIYDNKVAELGGGERHTTNNRMELTAAIEALNAVSDKHITIYTDSEYVMKGMNEWIHNWQKKNWKTANKKPVLNQDLWQKLLEVVGDRKIEWKYVASHVGIRLNERADEIATAFADNFSPILYNGPRDKYK